MARHRGERGELGGREAGQLVAQTEALVKTIAGHAPLSLRAMKAMLSALGSRFQPDEVDRFDQERLAISRSEDMREGLERAGFSGGWLSQAQ